MGTTMIAALIMAATTVGMGVAQNVSNKRGAEAQDRVDTSRDEFAQETADINRGVQAKQLAAQKNIFGQKKALDTANLKMQESDLKDAGKRAEGQRRQNLLGQVTGGSTSKNLELADKNILRLGGGK
jgi:uncharacterized protein YycO